MSNNIYHLPQCTCSAFFLTNDALNAHLDEYRAQESYLSAQLEICRSHSKANDGDDPDSDDNDSLDVNEDSNSPVIRHDSGEKTHICPLEECERNKPFKTRRGLRRHFEQHTKCEEICVCCHRILGRASDYIRHAERHRDVGQPKAAYMNQMCDKLRDQVTNELGLAESDRVSRVERGRKKRAREGGYIDTRTSGVQKARLHAAFSPSTQSATVPMPLPYVAEPVATGGFPNMSTEAFYLESIEGLTVAPDDHNFDAPINGIINFPQPWTR